MMQRFSKHSNSQEPAAQQASSAATHTTPVAANDLDAADSCFDRRQFAAAAGIYRAWLGSVSGTEGGRENGGDGQTCTSAREQRWGAMHNLGRCCMEVGDYAEAEFWMQRAGGEMPDRPQPFVDLMQHFSGRGQHHKAMHYAKEAAGAGERMERRAGVRVPTDAEGGGAANGDGRGRSWFGSVMCARAVSGFYLKNDCSLTEGARAAMDALDADQSSTLSERSAYMCEPTPSVQRAFSNLLFYLQPLSVQPGATVRALRIPPEFLDRFCRDTPNPSSSSLLRMDGGDVLVCVRCVNYTYSPARKFIIHHPQNKFVSQTVFGRLHLAHITNTHEHGTSITPHDLCLGEVCFSGIEDRAATSQIVGLEDVRVFHSADRSIICFVAAQCQYTAHGNIRQMQGRVELGAEGSVGGSSTGVRLTCATPMEPPTPTACEKNWIPLPCAAPGPADGPAEGPTLWIYSWHPLRICRECAHSSAGTRLRTEIEHPTPALWRWFRGSTIPVLVRSGELWLVVHFVHGQPLVNYYHAVIVLDAVTYAPLRTSVPFVFEATRTVEYCIGMIAHDATERPSSSGASAAAAAAASAPPSTPSPSSPPSNSHLTMCFSSMDFRPKLLTIPVSALDWVNVPIHPTPSRPIHVPDLPRRTAFVTCVFKTERQAGMMMPEMHTRLRSMAQSIPINSRLHVFCDAENHAVVAQIAAEQNEGGILSASASAFEGCKRPKVVVHVLRLHDTDTWRHMARAEDRVKAERVSAAAVTADSAAVEGSSSSSSSSDCGSLPHKRNLLKDTRTYLLLIMAKAEFLCRARRWEEARGMVDLRRTPGTYMWMDAGITRLLSGAPRGDRHSSGFGDERDLAFFTDAVRSVPKCPTAIIAAGLWARAGRGANICPHNVNWRFAGGLIAIPERAVEWFAEQQRAVATSIFESSKTFTWEVNLWAAMEAAGVFEGSSAAASMKHAKCSSFDATMMTAVMTAWKEN